MKSRLSKPVMLKTILLAMVLSLFVVNAYAINLMFMSKQSPGRKFSDEDWKHFDQAIAHTLKHVDDGASYRWNNPGTPAAGSIEVLESTTMNQTPCRRLRLTNTYEQLRGVSEFVFCKQSDGEWKVAQ